jgi:nucleotide-binding universal stress UspA family protein
MNEHLIVVPLDGSELSESALPYATELAKTMGCRVLLVSAWEEATGGMADLIPQSIRELRETGEAELRAFLDGAAAKVGAAGVDVKGEVHVGNPRDVIERVIDEHDPLFLVLTTHGRSGIGRWVYGSVAGKLVREAAVPTLVVGPRVLEQQTDATIKRILVPLDGSELSEGALTPARDIALAFGAGLLVVEVLNFASQAMMFGVPTVDVTRIDEDLTQAAEEYLAKTAERLGGDISVSTQVLRGPPADALRDCAKEADIDLVVMASHSRSGIARAALGSVADRMLQGPAPVLLVRPEAQGPVAPAAKGRYCHACGRTAPYTNVLPDDRCPRCGQHLHVCQNCVYYDGTGCMLQRPEVRDTPPGLQCPDFQFRETEKPGAEGKD